MIIKCDAVKVITVPQFEGLAIQQIFQFACNMVDVQNALPPSKEISKLSRSYLANVIYTIVGEPFQQWVHQQVNIRNQKIAVEGNNVIAMDPQIARIFMDSTAISGKCLRLPLPCFVFSVEGQIEPPDEGLCPAPQVSSPALGGEDLGAA
jgi:hypothetical protein